MKTEPEQTRASDLHERLLLLLHILSESNPGSGGPGFVFQTMAEILK